MAVERTFTPKLYEDFLSSFEAGMNSGVSPLLLSRNQLGFALNTSVRGGFARNRPPYQIKTLNFGGNTALQRLFQTGLFQGAGYYRPDVGTESLMASISGHLLLFTEVNGVWNVSDVSIPGDLNSATAGQVWMWQTEKWMVVQDGTGKLPIFFDGVSSRRSYGPSVLLATTAADFTPPAIGKTVSLTLTAPYTGPYNVPVILNGEFYQPTQNAAGYNVILTNVSGAPGTTIAAGTPVTINPASVGVVTQFIDGSTGSGFGYVDVVMSSITGLAVGNFSPPNIGTNHGTQVKVSGISINGGPAQTLLMYAVSVNAANNQVRFQAASSFTGSITVALNSIAQLASSSGPTVIVGNTVTSFVEPAVGVQVTMTLTQPYSGVNGQLVYLGTEAYTIANPAAGPGSTTLIVINLSDTSTSAAHAPKTLMSVPEIPAGRMGAYGMGCNGVSLTNGISYVISDVVGSAAGTPANNYRDAVLKMTQNTFLEGGGSFSLPGTGDLISAMVFPPNLDTSLGQGPLQVGTPFSFFSNYVVGTYPGTWDTLTNPIQTKSLEDDGPQGQWSTVVVNSDTYFRSNVGIGTLILARREFLNNSAGNKSISNEVRRVLDPDNLNLLPWASARSFDNRFQCTCSPQTSSAGVYHQGIVSENFDLISTQRESLPPAWEGLWTGLNTLQMVTGRISGVRRTFHFSYNLQTLTIELYEQLMETTSQYLDNGTTPIVWAFETPVLFNKTVKSVNELVQLRDGEIYLSDIQGQVTVAVYYKPDFYPCWTPWKTFTVCQSTDAANSKDGYRMRVGLGEPDVTPCEVANNRPLRNGYFFQCRVVITGACTFKGMRASAISLPQTVYAPVECTQKPGQLIDCDVPNDFTLYSLQGTQVPTPGPMLFANDTIYFKNWCPSTTCSAGGPVPLGAVPGYLTVDTAGNQIIGAAGVVLGTSQADADAKATALFQQVITGLQLNCPQVSSTVYNLNWTIFPGSLSDMTVVQNVVTFTLGSGPGEDSLLAQATICNPTNNAIRVQAAWTNGPFSATDPTPNSYVGVMLNNQVMYYDETFGTATPPGWPPGGQGPTTIVLTVPANSQLTLTFDTDALKNASLNGDVTLTLI